MGMMTSAILAMGVAQGASQMMSGHYAEVEARANAGIMDMNAKRLDVQAAIIDQQKGMQAARDDRLIRFTMGKSVATTAAKGLELSGSPLAVMIDTQTQLEMDKAIGQYNYDLEKRRVMTNADLTRVGARAMRQKGKSMYESGIAKGMGTMSKAAMQATISSGFDSKAKVETGVKTSPETNWFEKKYGWN